MTGEGFINFCYQQGIPLTLLKGKCPIRLGWQNEGLLPREVVEAHVNSGGNLGVVTGGRLKLHSTDNDPVFLLIIDVDKGADYAQLPEPLPQSWTVITGGGGQHIYTKTRNPNLGISAGKLARHVDTRGKGGQGVAPGSIYPETGRQYEWAPGCAPDEVDLAWLPASYEAKLVADRACQEERMLPGPPLPVSLSSAPAGPPILSRYVNIAICAETAAVRNARIGERNHILNKAAFNLGQLIPGGYLPYSVAEDELMTAALQAGLPWHEADQTIKSGLAAGMRHPRVIRPLVAMPAPVES